MNSTEFLDKARAVLSNDIQTRIHPEVKTALADPNCLIDIHAHIFDRKCIHVRYFLLRVLKSKLREAVGMEMLESDGLLAKSEAEIYKEIAKGVEGTQAEWEKLESELEDLDEMAKSSGLELFGLNIGDALKVIRMRNQKEVLDNYINKLSLVQLPEHRNKPLVLGILMMDLETGWNMTPDKKLHKQIDEIRDIMYDRTILPFFPIDPRRADMDGPNENLYELFLKAFDHPDRPFFGVKCYPSMGYLPSDKRLDPIFQICEEMNIPVLAHCGGESVSTFEQKIEVDDDHGRHMYLLPGNSRLERARNLNNPEAWLPVLQKHPGLKINLAHFGGDQAWKNLNSGLNDVRVMKIIEMMKNPEWKVFADFSYNLVDSTLYSKFRELYDANPDLHNKILYGTDYWVVLPEGDFLLNQKGFIDFMGDRHKHLLNFAPLNYIIN